MMEPVIRVNGLGASPCKGHVKLDLMKCLWNGTMITASLCLSALFFTWSAFIIFLLLTYITLLLGHSVGMHRMMIHRTFTSSKLIERFLIYIGVLVGIGGPTDIIKVHDTRDWAQRQGKCHEFFSHNRSYVRDLTWQLFYKFEFSNPPTLTIEKSLSQDPWYVFFDKTWRVHQLILAIVLFAIGGIPWVVWGVFVRLTLSAIGHWSITYICHNPGPGKWHVNGAGVQASNINFAGFLTHGECWHNNHHAFPESAKIGLEKGQTDPAWWIIKTMNKLGLAKNISLPRHENLREDLRLKIKREPNS